MLGVQDPKKVLGTKYTMKEEELTVFRRRNIGFVFQNYSLVPVLNVYENTVLPSGDQWSFHSTLDVLENWNSMMFSLRLIGNGAALLLIVIGPLNFMNVMFTSVLARRRELCVLGSIGMTKRQIRRMLMAEGGVTPGFRPCSS